jgi:oxygen-independent coproporphyrinogen-3 oxidase
MKTLYIHIPFCGRKCFYCSFVVSIGQEHRIGLYIDCLEQETRRYKGSAVQSIYIGGGTPTLMEDAHLGRLFDIIHENFRFSPGIEWTIESNPEGLTSSKLALIKQAGVNRVSLGVQSLQDKYLKYLGRNHDALAAVRAYHQLREAGYDNVNVDLMFLFPGQTADELSDDISDVIRLGSEHLSLYTLTIEKNSRFYARDVQLQDGDEQARRYLLVRELLGAAGFEQYEISNFAKPGKISRHNMHYWQGGEYVGLGLGAHSYINLRRSWNVSQLTDYIKRAQKGTPFEDGFEELTLSAQFKENILFGLRMNRGVDIHEIEKGLNCSLTDEDRAKLKQFIEHGLLVEENNRLKTTSKGRLVLDEICARLI